MSNNTKTKNIYKADHISLQNTHFLGYKHKGYIKMGYKIKKETNRIQKKREMKKKPSNAYPKLAFRIDAETKEELLAWIDSLYCHYLDRKEKEQYTIKKNDIIIEALRIGLKKIEQDIKNVPLLKKKNQSLKDWQRRNPKPKGKGNTLI